MSQVRISFLLTFGLVARLSAEEPVRFEITPIAFRSVSLRDEVDVWSSKPVVIGQALYRGHLVRIMKSWVTYFPGPGIFGLMAVDVGSARVLATSYYSDVGTDLSISADDQGIRLRDSAGKVLLTVR